MHEDGVIDKKRSGNCNCFLFPEKFDKRNLILDP